MSLEATAFAGLLLSGSLLLAGLWPSSSVRARNAWL
jgi:hypothetical protein